MSLPLTELFSTNGLVAVVTGGGTGIGLMIATALENSGATVYIVGRRKEVIEKAAKEHARHGKLIPLQCDVTCRSSLEALVSSIESQVGFINLLVNNCGTSGPSDKFPPRSADIKTFQTCLLENNSESFQKTFEVNHTAMYFVTVAFLQLLDEGNKRGGIPDVSSQVINIASVAAFRREERPQTGLAYILSKVAAVHLTKILASILVDYDIRCNAICPGIYPSEMTQHLPQTIPASEVPMLRQGNTNDMAGLTLYLASTAGAYTTGGIFVTDGGRIMAFPGTY